MSNNIIIELSNKNATFNFSNAEFSTNFPNIIINNGDTINIKNVFIDTLQQDYTQINIPEDINLYIAFCYYEIDNFNYPTSTGSHIYCKSYSDNVSHPGTGPDNSQVPDYKFYFSFTKETTNNNERYLEKNGINILLKKGVYTPNSLAIEITKGMVQLNYPQSGLTQRINPFVYQVIAHPNQYYNVFAECVQAPGSTPNAYINWTNEYHYINDVKFMSGARQVSLVYNDEGNNRFEWQYIHSPYYDADKNECISWINDGGNVVNRNAGIVFLDLQPANFWTSLGFDLDKIIMKWDDINANLPNIVNFDEDKMTTQNFLSLDDIFGGQNMEVVPTFTKISNVTKPISASQFYKYSDLSPYITVELLTNYNNSYITKDNNNKNISAIVSRNYASNNYITGYSDSSISYNHIGPSMSLSNIKAKLLNSNTGELCTDLGPNNTILVEIIKNSS